MKEQTTLIHLKSNILIKNMLLAIIFSIGFIFATIYVEAEEVDYKKIPAHMSGYQEGNSSSGIVRRESIIDFRYILSNGDYEARQSLKDANGTVTEMLIAGNISKDGTMTHTIKEFLANPLNMTSGGDFSGQMDFDLGIFSGTKPLSNSPETMVEFYFEKTSDQYAEYIDLIDYHKIPAHLIGYQDGSVSSNICRRSADMQIIKVYQSGAYEGIMTLTDDEGVKTVFSVEGTISEIGLMTLHLVAALENPSNMTDSGDFSGILNIKTGIYQGRKVAVVSTGEMGEFYYQKTNDEYATFVSDNDYEVTTITMDDKKEVSVGEDIAISAELKSSSFVPTSTNMTWHLEYNNGAGSNDITIGNMSIIDSGEGSYIISSIFNFKKEGEYEVTLKSDDGARATCNVTVDGGLQKVSNFKGETGNHRELSFSWDEMEKADGYYLQKDTNPDNLTDDSEVITINGVTSWKTSIPQKRGAKIYARICAYQISKGKCVRGEWSDIVQVQIGNQVLAKEMPGFVNPTAELNYGDYFNVMGTAGLSVYLHDCGQSMNSIIYKGIPDSFTSYGLCYGMVNAALASLVCEVPPENTYRRTMNETKTIDSAKSNTTLNERLKDFSLYDFVKYGQILQSTSCNQTQNTTDLNGLVNAVLSCQRGEGNPVEISIGESDQGGHRLLAVAVDSDTEKETIIEIYDPNYPVSNSGDISNIISLLKDEDGNYSGWRFYLGASIVWEGNTNGTDEGDRLYYDIGSYYGIADAYPTVYDQDRVLSSEKILIRIDSTDMTSGEIVSYLRENGIPVFVPTNDATIDENNNNSFVGWVDKKDISLKDFPKNSVVSVADCKKMVAFEVDSISDIKFSKDEMRISCTPMEVNAEYTSTIVIDNTHSERRLVKGRIEDDILTIESKEKELIVAGSNKFDYVEKTGTINQCGQFVDMDTDVMQTVETDKDRVSIITKDDGTINIVENVHTHIWNSGIITTPATCTTKGIKTYICSCGETRTEEIPETGHSWDDGVITTQPTTTSTGVKTYTCSTCGQTRTETVAELSAPVTPTPVANVITASDITIIYYTGNQSLNIGASCLGGAKLTYTSNNSNITVNSAGQVTVKAKYMGQAVITITSSATAQYKAAMKQITVTVTPKKTTISKATSPKKKTLKVTWKKNATASGYQVYVSTSKTFASNTKACTVKGQKKLSATATKLKSKKKYYAKVRAYKTVSGKKIYGPWSAVKACKVK